ncbi:MAG: hypothetical protein SF097_00390 [Acidobacteriota bacterium]|nr:hypothetical protein [Acidobacteriota bacterium]
MTFSVRHSSRSIGQFAEIAEQIATHEKMKKLCLRAGEKHLVAMADAEELLRKALRLMGYGMPRV